MSVRLPARPAPQTADQSVVTGHGVTSRTFPVSDQRDGLGAGPFFSLNAGDRGSFGPNGMPSLTSADAGAQIARANQSWATALGTAATVTWAFRESVTTMPNGASGFSQFNADQIAATALALAAWSDVAGITFQRVQNAGSEYSNNATILLGAYTEGLSDTAAFANLPGGMPGVTASQFTPGDIWVNSSLSYNALPVQLGYGQKVLLHEIGHAIGLSHPGSYNVGGRLIYSSSAAYYEDSRQYTVMSYFSEGETGADFGGRYASAPLLDDISAAQHLYGANMSTRTGDTIYGFNSTADRVWFEAETATSALVFCAWDAGGDDTFDFSGYANDGVIDLREGAFSSVGGLIGNVSIAMGVVIENAIGGSGHDRIRGNEGDNRITGGAGDDIITGGLGNDWIDGGDGHDIVTVSGAFSEYRLLMNGDDFILKGPDGGDRLTGVESIRFEDGRVLELNRMYGPAVDASPWADGRIPETLLSGGEQPGVAPEVQPAADDAFIVDAKGLGGFEVLPGVNDWTPMDARDFDQSETLPGLSSRALFNFDPISMADLWSGQLPMVDEQGLVVDRYIRGGWGSDGCSF